MTALPKTLLKKKAFSYQEIIKSGISRHYLHQMLADNKIEKISRNLYSVDGYNVYGQEEQYRVATIKVGGPSAICLLSALDFYDLTDEIPNKVWVFVPHQKRIRSNTIKCIRTRNPYWSIGIKKHDRYSVTSLERTIIDCLVYKRVVGANISTSSLKRAIGDKKIDIDSLISMAKKMRCFKRIIPYIEMVIHD